MGSPCASLANVLVQNGAKTKASETGLRPKRAVARSKCPFNDKKVGSLGWVLFPTVLLARAAIRLDPGPRFSSGNTKGIHAARCLSLFDSWPVDRLNNFYKGRRLLAPLALLLSVAN